MDLIEILKDCPKGMELYSPIFGKVYLEKIRPHLAIVVTTDKKRRDFKKEFLYDGRYGMNGECMLFPSKENRDWSKFQRPFKDGDIVFYNDTIGIFKEWGDETLFRTYVCTYLTYPIIDVNIPLFGKYIRRNTRLATEEEKQKLFDTIKENGYKWNAETKTLERLKEPVGDKGNISDGYHTFNELYEYRLLYNAGMFNEFAKLGLYDVHKSKCHSDGEECFGGGWFIVQAQLPTGQISNHYELKDWDLFKIPEKERANEWDGHTPKDVAKRLRMFLTSKKPGSKV